MSEKPKKIVITCPGNARKSSDLENADKIKCSYGPSWYQELSSAQMIAANNLSNAIQEDLEQGTLDRCKRALRGIGIKPILNKMDLKVALELSKGNDLAFLWFLYDIFYVSPADNRNYSLNERILLSVICHLDMITSLRELDAILPQPYVREKKVLPVIPSPKKRIYASPYLEPLPRPKAPRSRPLPPPDVRGPNFAPYTTYKDKFHNVSNESNRWFAKVNVENDFDRSELLDKFCSEIIHDEYDKEYLYQEFIAAVQCNCKGTPLLNMKKIQSDDLIYKIQFDTATSKIEFLEYCRIYRTQILVKIIVKYLCFIEPDTQLSNIVICSKCPSCRQALEILQTILRRNYNECEGLDEMGDSPFYKCDYENRLTNTVFPGQEDLKVKCCRLLKEFDKMSDGRPFDICLKNVWKLEIKLWMEKIKKFKNVDLDSLKLSGEKIDPRNSNQMTTLLKAAMWKLSQNSKLLLPTMPDVHKLPILNEWIKVRYGFKYTRKNRQNALISSLKQWERLFQVKLNDRVRVPSAKDVARVGVKLTYEHKNMIVKCINGLNETYYKCLNIALINDARRFWRTMNPYLCAIGPPRDTFYAYLPACEYDLYPFRPWPASQFRDMVADR